MGKYTHEDFEIGETYLITTNNRDILKLKIQQISFDTKYLLDDEMILKIEDVMNIELYEEYDSTKYSDQEKLIIQKCEEVKELLIRKNRDYGNSAQKSYDKWGNMAFMIRIEDKMNRLENLIKNGENNLVKDESLYDTIQDTAGYLLLWMTEMSKKENKQ